MMRSRFTKRVVAILTLTTALSVLPAHAATRYAAPGGTGKDPCVNPARPCSVFTAADRNASRSTLEPGDVIELAPGTYRAEFDGEFGDLATVSLPNGVTIRGSRGKAPPLIVLRDNETGYGAFYVPFGSAVMDVEIHNRSQHGAAIGISGGLVERVVARSTAGSEFACNMDSGIMRSSACLSSGGVPALGVNIASKGRFESVIRNSTLVATGPGSVGMDFVFHAFKRGMTVNIDVVGTLIEGDAKDMAISALALNKGRGADVKIGLEGSSFATVGIDRSNGGTVGVTRPGTNGNIKEPPLLAGDNLHQLPGSPTIDGGALDGASGSADVDAQPRTMGEAPDIGADELGPGTHRANPTPDTVLVQYGPSEEPLYERTPRRTAEFTFGSSEPGSRFECKLDRGRYRACSSPYRRKVGLGRHRFQVRARDPQGKVDPTPAAFSWRVLPWRAFLR